MDDYKKPTRGANAYDHLKKEKVKITQATSEKIARRAVFPEKGIDITNWPPKNYMG